MLQGIFRRDPDSHGAIPISIWPRIIFFLLMGSRPIVVEDQLFTCCRRPLGIRKGRRGGHLIELHMPRPIPANQRRDVCFRIPARFGGEGWVFGGGVGGFAAVRGADPAGVAEEGLDTRERDDDGGDEAFAVCPAQGDAEGGQAFEGVVDAKDGADHDEDAGGEHGG